ncbi:MAG: hypothetical protein FJX72_15715 [Armatimonadetes bacterium]|nr:hypothetical protein [Armatimonadota bacterium]
MVAIGPPPAEIEYLLALGLLLGAIFRRARAGWALALCEGALVATAALAALVLLANLYSANPVLPRPAHLGVAWPLAGGALGAAALLLGLGRDLGGMAYLRADGSGSRFLRLALPCLVAISASLGYVGLGVSLSRTLDQALVTALAVVVFIAASAAAAWLLARILDRSEEDRRRAAAAIEAARLEEQRSQLNSFTLAGDHLPVCC